MKIFDLIESLERLKKKLLCLKKIGYCATSTVQERFKEVVSLQLLDPRSKLIALTKSELGDLK